MTLDELNQKLEDADWTWAWSLGQAGSVIEDEHGGTVVRMAREIEYWVRDKMSLLVLASEDKEPQIFIPTASASSLERAILASKASGVSEAT